MSSYNVRLSLKAFLLVAFLVVTSVAQAQTLTYTMPIEPGPLDGQVVFLTLVGPAEEGWVTNVTMNLTFETAGTFDASDLELLLGAPVEGSPDWSVVGGLDLGWSGQGTFSGSISTTSLNGQMQLGLPGFPTIWDLTIWPASGSGGVSGQFFNSEIVIEYSLTPPTPETDFIRGDFNNDGVVSFLVDALFGLNAGFVAGSPQPSCQAAADANGDNEVSFLIDSLFMLNAGFVAGSPIPPAPYPDCGPDQVTVDALGCATPSCP